MRRIVQSGKRLKHALALTDEGLMLIGRLYRPRRFITK